MGLPVLAPRPKTYERLFADAPTGAAFDSVEEAVASIPRLLEMRPTTNLRERSLTYESNVDRLISYYQDVLSGGRTPAPGDGTRREMESTS